jgi:hypothetical protein
VPDALPEKTEIPMSVRLVDADNPVKRAGRRLDSRCRNGEFRHDVVLLLDDRTRDF